jgi:tRNA(fMet)-specific endonuclease VapC
VTTGFVFDTNILSALLQRERQIVLRITELELQIPSIVVGELFAWAHSPSRDRITRLQSVRILLSMAPILTPDVITGERYGLIYTELHQQGNLIPANDIWIAALALQHNCTLVTRDAHFRRVSDLSVEYW